MRGGRGATASFLMQSLGAGSACVTIGAWDEDDDQSPSVGPAGEGRSPCLRFSVGSDDGGNGGVCLALVTCGPSLWLARRAGERPRVLSAYGEQMSVWHRGRPQQHRKMCLWPGGDGRSQLTCTKDPTYGSFNGNCRSQRRGRRKQGGRDSSTPASAPQSATKQHTPAPTHVKLTERA
jgi:hypothetical protein